MKLIALLLIAQPGAALTIGECANGLLGSGFDFTLFERYHDWYDNNSSLTLVQTGTYTGLDDIEEYVR